MGKASIAKKKLIELTRAVEADEHGTAGGVRQRVYCKEVTWEAQGGKFTKGENRNGERVTTSLAPSAREGAQIKIHADLVIGLNTDSLADFLGIAGPEALVAITDSTVAAVPDAVHADGTVGPAIVADPGVLLPFVGAEDLLLDSSGWTEADNAWPRAIKSAHPDGSQIDLDPLYVQGEPGTFGAPLVQEAAGSPITLSVGKSMRTGADDRWVSFEGISPDIGLYQMFVGALCSKYQFEADGGGKCKEMFDYVARDYLEATQASRGAEVMPLPEARNDHVSAKQVQYAVLGGSTVISQTALTSAKWTGDAAAEGHGGALGADSLVSVTRGDIDFEGELETYHKVDVTLLLTQLGRLGQQVPFDFLIKDLDGNRLFYRFPRIGLDEKTIPSDGKGTWPFSAAAGRDSAARLPILGRGRGPRPPRNASLKAAIRNPELRRAPAATGRVEVDRPRGLGNRRTSGLLASRSPRSVEAPGEHGPREPPRAPASLARPSRSARPRPLPLDPLPR